MFLHLSLEIVLQFVNGVQAGLCEGAQVGKEGVEFHLFGFEGENVVLEGLSPHIFH